ncbi:minor tail protein [Microbacterium phage OscarSo]|uniref:Minor tail protein n=1 Tax=Microbacterium phage OscarSo TaxID=2985324 RepID=A0A9X9P641_9CAUD|nr:minor tail protein [Microbacterium phage OscarSo]UYL87130.1 minor tail protein [Microbacterium phage OscarSo]
MTTGTVTARFLAEDGTTPLSGFVRFYATTTYAAGRGVDNLPAILALQESIATLDAQGRISIELVATDDPHLSPIGWQWVAAPVVKDAGERVSIPELVFDLPGASTVKLEDITPSVELEPGVIITRGVPGPMGPASVAVSPTAPAEPGVKMWIETAADGDPDAIRLYFEDGE